MDHNVNRSRGSANEAMVEEALIAIMQRNGSNVLPPIERIVHAVPNSNLDRKGIDFIVKLKNGCDICLQVKSSKRARRKFEKKCRNIGISIPVIVVSTGMKFWQIVRSIVKTIKLVLDSLQRKTNEKIHQLRIKSERKRKKKDRCRRDFAFCMCH